MSGEGAVEAPPSPPDRASVSRTDTVVSVVLVVVAWVGAALVLGLVLFSLTFLDDCDRPACNVPRGLHVFYAGVLLTVAVALLGARRTFARRRGRRWPFALLTLGLVALCVVGTALGLYVGLDLHPELFARQQLR